MQARPFRLHRPPRRLLPVQVLELTVSLRPKSHTLVILLALRLSVEEELESALLAALLPADLQRLTPWRLLALISHL